MIRVSFGPAALKDLREILAYLAGDNPRVASDFAIGVASLRARLSAFPNSGTLTRRKTHRFAMISGFQYKVYYRSVGDGELRIVRIRHSRRRPLKLS